MSSKNILIVEDDAILLFTSEKMMSALGHTVVGRAKSGQGAIDQARKSDPDLILMDIRLLGPMDGIEAMMEINKFSNARVVYISGNSDSKSYERAQKTNMIAFLVKPISFEMLEEIIK